MINKDYWAHAAPDGTHARVIDASGAAHDAIASNKPQATGGPWWSAGGWTMIAVTWDSMTGTVRVYVDGAKAGDLTGAAFAMATIAKTMWVGREVSTATGAHSAESRLDRARVYDGVLSSGQIQLLYQGEKP